MKIRGEACIIYTHALNDLLIIILEWNQFVSLNAFVYLLSCWVKLKINKQIIANKSKALSLKYCSTKCS